MTAPSENVEDTPTLTTRRFVGWLVRTIVLGVVLGLLTFVVYVLIAMLPV